MYVKPLGVRAMSVLQPLAVSPMERFASMSDAELLHVAVDMRELHPDAADAVRLEITRRDLPIPDTRRGTRTVRAVGIATRAYAALPIALAILALPSSYLAGSDVTGALLGTLGWALYAGVLLWWGGALIRGSKWAARLLVIPVIWRAAILLAVILGTGRPDHSL